MEMDNPIIKQMMDTQAQMLSLIQTMQSQTSSVIQQNTTALQNSQSQVTTPQFGQNQTNQNQQNMQGFQSPFAQPMMGSIPGMYYPGMQNMLPGMYVPGMQSLLPNMFGAPMNQMFPGNNLQSSPLGTFGDSALNIVNNAIGYGQTSPAAAFQQVAGTVGQEVENMFYDPREYDRYSAGKIPGLGIGFFAQRHASFKGYQSSAEAQENFVYDTTNAMEQNLISIGGGVTKGLATLGGFSTSFIPGMPVAGGAVIGGVIGFGANLAVNETIRGTKMASETEEIIRQNAYKIFNPLESTNEFGRAGLKRDDLHIASDKIRNLGVDLFMDDSEMQRILTGAIDSKLMKTSSDLDSFVKKFKETAELTKKIMMTMDMSIEEATKMMGEFEHRGVSMGRMHSMGASIKTAAMFGSMTSTESMNKVFSVADSITPNTAINAGNVMETSAFNLAASNIFYDNVIQQDPYMKQYFKNIGGPNEFGTNVERTFRGYMNQNKELFLSMYAPAFDYNEEAGTFSINQERFDAITSSGKSFKQLQAEGQQYFNQFNEAEKMRLLDMSPTLIQNQMDSGIGMADVMRKTIDRQKAMMSRNTDDTTALKVAMGITYEEAASMTQYLDYIENPEVQKAIGARELAEKWSAGLEPGIIDETKKVFKEFSNETFGATGQKIHNVTSDVLFNINAWLENSPDRSTTGNYIDYTDEKFREDLFSQKTYQEMEQKMRDAGAKGFSLGASPNMNVGIQEISHEEFTSYLEKIESGNFTTEDTIMLSSMLNRNDVGDAAKERAKMVLDVRSGKYKANSSQVQNYTKTSSNTSDTYDTTTGQSMTVTQKQKVSSADIKDDYKETIKTLGQEKKDAETRASKLFARDDFLNLQLSDEDKLELDRAIKLGLREEALSMVGGSQSVQKTVEGLLNTYDEIEKNEKGVAEVGMFLKDQEDYARGLVQSGNYIQQSLKDAGVVNYKDRSKEMQKIGEKLQKAIDDGDYTTMKELTVELDSSIIGMFKTMSVSEKEKYAKDFATHFNGNVEDYMVNGRYDDRALEEGFRVMVSSLNKADSLSPDGKKATGDGLKSELDIHNQNFDQLVNTMKNEILIMQEALTKLGQPVKNTGRP